MRLGRINIGRTLLVGTAIVALVLAMAWSQRRPIAAGAIDRALAARGIQASYNISQIGLRTQRIENLRLGDPTNPDLTVEWAELALAPTWGGVTVTAINARGVRLRGRVVQGRVSWGAVDKLLPATTGKAFALPDVDVRLADTRVTLATALGLVTADIAGAGRLSNGFAGSVRATAPFLGPDGCRLEAPVATARVRTAQYRTQVVGTLRTGASVCEGVSVGSTRTLFDLSLSRAFDGWTGKTDISASGLRQEALQVAQVQARVAFTGTTRNTKGSFALSAPAARYDATRMGALAADGTFTAGAALLAEGQLRVGRAMPDPAQIASLRRALAGASGTPVGPLAAALSQAFGRAGQGAKVAANFAYRGATTRISDVRIAARGGARLTLGGGTVSIDATGVAADADVALSGGGFPVARGRLRRSANGSTDGIFQVAPLSAANARLILAPIRFAARRDGTMRIETFASLDGPLADGRAEGVRLPLVIQRSASGDIMIAPGCTPIAFRRIAVAGTTFAPGRITLCPNKGGALLRSARGGFGGGASTGPLQLIGQVGDEPLIMTATGASFDLGGPVLLADFSALLGSNDRRTRVFIDRIDGVARPSGLSGRFTGLSGNIARVPFLVSKGQGTWALTGGTLDIAGMTMVADEAAIARFNPLSARGIKLRLKDRRIAADATIVEPVSARPIATVALAHDLDRSSGEARLAVNALNFSKSLQPEAITPLTEGVIADVYGQIDGTGVVRWQGDRITSTGKFRTDAIDFAAAFGPVTGASGEVEFDDLVALSTPPGQQVKLVLVNPGVEVKDGVITYRLRPNQIVEIERGRWPFAGGEMLLEPTSLDFGQSKPRTLKFRVVALDAAKFIEQLKLENIAATGTFDGVLPIVFDASGGQIVGGQIVARSGGGTLAYVGDVSNAETNTLAKLAFDALKSIRYGNLAIDLDGSLDGEIVSLVRFDGINQSPVAPSGIAKSFTGLPFKFNIRVRAPFRGLVNTARSYQDPGLLLNRTVQPVASEARP